MPDKSARGFDRRDLIVASMATVGAAAAVAVNGSAANAHAATPPANPASGTVYTGDVIEGKKVVSALDVNDLEPGKKHRLYFRGVETPTGQYWYVSVTVAKGAKLGKRGVLTSGVHGDEISSVHTVQSVMNQLAPSIREGRFFGPIDAAAASALTRRTGSRSAFHRLTTRTLQRA